MARPDDVLSILAETGNSVSAIVWIIIVALVVLGNWIKKKTQETGREEEESFDFEPPPAHDQEAAHEPEEIEPQAASPEEAIRMMVAEIVTVRTRMAKGKPEIKTAAQMHRQPAAAPRHLMAPRAAILHKYTAVPPAPPAAVLHKHAAVPVPAQMQPAAAQPAKEQPAAAAAAPSGLERIGMGRSELQRAVIYSEVLGRPLSTRDPGAGYQV